LISNSDEKLPDTEQWPVVSVSILTTDLAQELGLPPWAVTLASLAIGATISVVGTAYVIKDASGKTIDEIDTAPALTQSTGRQVYAVKDSGTPGLWSWDKFKRGDFIDWLLGNDRGHNYPIIDKFNHATEEATSIKSLDTTKPTYQSVSKLQSRLDGYVDDLTKFTYNTTGSDPIYPGELKSRILEVAIPDCQLTRAQNSAIDAAIAYAQTKGVDLRIIVVK
jgi:hypothetical protein